MLEPQDRHLLLEALRPPPGHRLDFALGSTFSLDLFALLTAPLAFTFFDWEGEGGEPTADPLALLESVRRHAERIAIFCQAGRIQVPRGHQRLYAYLENSVIEAAAPRAGAAFHPKVWVLRFVVPEGPVAYRVLCLSRNLTFDRSWDTMLRLDGELVDRTYAFGGNHPLGDFVAALPTLGTRPVSAGLAETVERMAHEVRRVRFDLPAGFETVRFWPLGISGHGKLPFEANRRRLLVMSPFLSNDLLQRVSERRDGCVLISRLEAAAELGPETLARFEQVYVLSPEAEPEEEGDADRDPFSPDGGRLSGLHAKLYVMDDGWDARVWTGSANATDTAFEGNVEFLVELMGKKSRCGIDKLLEQARGSTAFADLLQAFRPGDDPAPVDPERRELERRLEEARQELSRLGLVAVVEEAEGDGGYRLRLAAEQSLPFPTGLSVRCWPVTLRPEASKSWEADGTLPEFGPVSLDALTSFFAFELAGDLGGERLSTRFVLKAPLEGAPADRQEHLLRSLLQNRSQVLRLLLLLLADASVEPGELPDLRGCLEPGNGRGRAGELGVPLLETLLRALGRDPSRLDRIQRLVEDLRRTPEGAELLPEGFDRVWPAIWTVREGMRR